MTHMSITGGVGKGQVNRPADVIAVHKRLMVIGKIPCYECSGTMDDTIIEGIMAVQRHFMRQPDGYITPGKTTQRILNEWSETRVSLGVQLLGRLQEAWDWVSPLLPAGSYCSSGYRSAERQRDILHRFFKQRYRRAIIKKYGKQKYDLVLKDLRKNEREVLAMVRGVGQAIAAPGRSVHQRGKAIDVGGPERIETKQVKVIKWVANAHPDLFSGKVLRERNGCVHFEIL